MGQGRRLHISASGAGDGASRPWAGSRRLGPLGLAVLGRLRLARRRRGHRLWWRVRGTRPPGFAIAEVRASRGSRPARVMHRDRCEGPARWGNGASTIPRPDHGAGALAGAADWEGTRPQGVAHVAARDAQGTHLAPISASPADAGAQGRTAPLWARRPGTAVGVASCARSALYPAAGSTQSSPPDSPRGPAPKAHSVPKRTAAHTKTGNRA